MDINYLNYLSNSNLQLIQNWDLTLSPIVQTIFRKTISPEPEWWIGSAKLIKSPIGSFYSEKSSTAAGTSIYPKEALLRTVGEAIERYSSTNSHLVDEIVALKINEDLGFIRCADFEDTVPAYKKQGITKEVEHTQVIKLVDNTFSYLPFEYVHLGFIRFKKQFMHTSPISTGCAFFYDRETAIWKGICEVVERDAMMRLWATKGFAIPIDPYQNNDYSLQTRLSRIKNSGLKIFLYEISSVINLPVMYAILEGKEFPYHCVGASCSADPLDAVNKAIDEAISIRVMAKANQFSMASDYDYSNFNWVNRLEKHMELYANWKDTPAFDFLKKNVKLPVPLSQLSNEKQYLKIPKNAVELTEIAKIFRLKGYDIYWKDISIEEVKQFGYVIKVVIPQMIPLSQSYECRWLDAFTETHLKKDLNFFPHPFA